MGKVDGSCGAYENKGKQYGGVRIAETVFCLSL